MGNELTVESLKASIYQYQPELISYNVVKIQDSGTQNECIIWKHMQQPQRLMQKKYFVKNWNQYNQLLEAFAFRLNNPFVVAAKHLIVENLPTQKMQTQNSFNSTRVRVFYEQSITNLSYFKEIPQQDAAYFLLQAFKGFQNLVQKIGFPFQIHQQMLHITESRQVKVWLGQLVWQLDYSNLLRLSGQNQMINQILKIIKSNIYFYPSKRQISSQLNQNDLQPIIIDEILNQNPQTLLEAIQLIEKYFKKSEIHVGNEMSCLNELKHDELINLMDMTRIKVRQNSPSHSIFLNSQGNMPVYSFRNISNIPTTSDQVINVQNKIKSRLSQRNISRSKSLKNKKSGLSLIKKNEDSCIQRTHLNSSNKNHQSLVIIKQKPLIVLRNMNSQIQIQNINTHLPPKCTKNIFIQNCPTKQSQNYNFIQIGNHQKILNKQNRATSSGIKNKGIQITKINKGIIKVEKQQSKIYNSSQNDKRTFWDIDQNRNNIKNYNQNTSSLVRFNNYFNQNNNHSALKLNQNNSIISVGNFPLPRRNCQNGGFNNRSISPNDSYQRFYNSSSTAFDPVLPNQSLTRFQKEFINLSNHNSSSQQFYQIPKIYVHSPKAKNKIFNLNSHSSKNNPTTTQNKQQKIDFVKEQKQNFKKQNPIVKNYQFQKYIENQKQEHIYTDPRLYEYITNNSSQNFMKINSIQKKQNNSVFDYLSNVQISESLDYETAEKVFQHQTDNRILNNKKTENSPQRFTLNDFPTIEQIQENPYDDMHQKQNASFLPISLNQAYPYSNENNKGQPSTIRRGYEESVVVQYKKFYDDTNRSNNSPNKHYFSPLKKNNIIENQVSNQVNGNQMGKKYETKHNWQTSPSTPLNLNRVSTQYGVTGPINSYSSNQIRILNNWRNHSPSPTTKLMYGRQKPAINPLLLQDMQKIKQNRVY